MSRSLRWLLVVCAVAIAGGAAWYFLKHRGPVPPKFTTVTLDKGSIVGKVTATGTVSALVTVQVGTQVSGRIQSLGADFNAKVTKGQILAKLDPELFAAALAQSRANERAAEANLEKSKAQLADSDRKLKRAKQLAEGKLIAQADLDAAQADYDVAVATVSASDASLMQARASRQQAEVNLTYTVIKSPIEGTVISRAVDVGQTVAASLQAPVIFTIAENLGRMQVDTNVAEADVGKLKEGLKATFLVDAFSGRPFTGTIRQIRFAPQVVQNVVTYDAVIDVENPELLLRPGMTANVTFTFARADDALRLPNAALRFRLDPADRPARPDGGLWGGRDGGFGGREGSLRAERGGGGDDTRGPRADSDMKAIWVLRDGQPARVMIKTGLSDGSFTQIIEGEVTEGDQVITERLADGTGPKPGGAGAGAGMGGMRRVF
jgi:HlyD family secretion protein